MPAKCLAMDGELLAQRKYEPTKKSNVVQQPCWIVRNSSLLVFANNCRRCRALILEFLRLRQWDQRVPCPAVWIVCKNIQTVIFDERIWVLSAAEIWALCIDIASEHLGMWPVFWRASLSLQFPSGSAIASKFVVVRFVRAFAFLCAVDAHQNLPRSQKNTQTQCVPWLLASGISLWFGLWIIALMKGWLPGLHWVPICRPN